MGVSLHQAGPRLPRHNGCSQGAGGEAGHGSGTEGCPQWPRALHVTQVCVWGGGGGGQQCGAAGSGCSLQGGLSVVDQGIKRVLQLRKISRSNRLTDQDLFYREVCGVGLGCEGWG